MKELTLNRKILFQPGLDSASYTRGCKVNGLNAIVVLIEQFVPASLYTAGRTVLRAYIASYRGFQDRHFHTPHIIDATSHRTKRRLLPLRSIGVSESSVARGLAGKTCYLADSFARTVLRSATHLGYLLNIVGVRKSAVKNFETGAWTVNNYKQLSTTCERSRNFVFPRFAQRLFLLGHHNKSLTQHYAAPDIKRLAALAERVTVRTDTEILR